MAEGREMMYTREQMVEAYFRGASQALPKQMAFDSYATTVRAETYVNFLKVAPRIAPEDITIDQSRFGHLPPNGTGEEVLARILASLLVRTSIMFTDQPGAQCMFSLDWQAAQLEALRTAYPILGALEDARVEEGQDAVAELTHKGR